MRIECFKLVTGEDVLAEVNLESEFRFVLNNPVAIAVVRGNDGQPNVGLAPFPIYAPQIKGAKIELLKTSISYHYVPSEDFVNNYNQIFGSGIVIPNKTLIKG